MQEIAEKDARAARTSFVSFFTPDDMLMMADNAGFKDAKTISINMEQYYFKNKADNLLPASGEAFLLATT